MKFAIIINYDLGKGCNMNMLPRSPVRVLLFLSGILTVFIVLSTWNLLHGRLNKHICGNGARGACATPQNGSHCDDQPTIRRPSPTEKMRSSSGRPTQSKRKKRPTETIDMVNGYHPFLNFSLNFPEVMPTLEQQENFLIIFVNSGARGEKYRQRRATIRDTWGSHNTCEQKKLMQNEKLSKLEWLLVFVLAKAGPGTDDDRRNKQEAKKYNDMLIGNIPDRYVNLILKFYMAQLWAASFGPATPKYTMKVDDDVYLRIPKVIEYLSDNGFPKRFYGGHTLHPHVVDRRPHGRWAVSWKYWPEKTFPPMNNGAYILLSTDHLSYLFNYVHVRKPFFLEDAYIAVALHDAKVRCTNIRSLDCRATRDMTVTIKQRNDCETLRLVGVAHNVETEGCKVLHNRIETMCGKNMSVKNTCHDP